MIYFRFHHAVMDKKITYKRGYYFENRGLVLLKFMFLLWGTLMYPYRWYSWIWRWLLKTDKLFDLIFMLFNSRWKVIFTLFSGSFPYIAQCWWVTWPSKEIQIWETLNQRILMIFVHFQPSFDCFDGLLEESTRKLLRRGLVFGRQLLTLLFSVFLARYWCKFFICLKSCLGQDIIGERNIYNYFEAFWYTRLNPLWCREIFVLLFSVFNLWSIIIITSIS